MESKNGRNPTNLSQICLKTHYFYSYMWVRGTFWLHVNEPLRHSLKIFCWNIWYYNAQLSPSVLRGLRPRRPPALTLPISTKAMRTESSRNYHTTKLCHFVTEIIETGCNLKAPVFSSLQNGSAIRLPQFPGLYENNLDCHWLFVSTKRLIFNIDDIHTFDKLNDCGYNKGRKTQITNV